MQTFENYANVLKRPYCWVKSKNIMIKMLKNFVYEIIQGTFQGG